MKTTTRRHFLATAAGCIAATGGLPAGHRILAAPDDSIPKEKLLVSLRDTHLREVGEKDCWAAVHATGADGVEVVLDDNLHAPRLHHPQKKYSLADKEGRALLVDDSRSAKVKLTALCLANRFDQRPDFEVEWTTRAARAAKALGIAAVRIDIVPRKLEGEEFFKLMVQLLGKILDATEDTGVALAIENHGNTTNRPEFLEKLFKEVPAKRLGLTLDTGNFYWFGHPLNDVYAIYEKFASRAHHTHLKSIRYPEERREERRPMGWEYGKYNCPIYEGDIDFRRVLKLLRRAGYRNDLCIENESLSKFPAARRREVLAREVRFLRELL